MSHQPTDSFVEKVRNETQSYIEDLLARVGQLEASLASCRQQRTELEEQLDRLAVQLKGSERRAERERDEKEKLLRRVAGIEEQNREVSDRYAEVARRNNDLASLYVASYQLHGSLERAEILAAIREIIINLIGSEEFAILTRDPEADDLELLTSFGLDADDWRPDPRLRALLDEGEIKIFDQDGPDSLVAAIPLVVGHRVTGLIALYSLLPQKEGLLGDLDRELCSLLSRQAASAIYCTRLQEHRPAATAPLP